VHRTPIFGIVITIYAYGQQIGKPNNLKVFGRKKTTGP